jgi:hypothetical protein
MLLLATGAPQLAAEVSRGTAQRAAGLPGAIGQ